MWEEERLKAFEWIRLKKVSRRVALAQQVQAIRRRSSSNPEDEEEAETETKEETE
ncbi:hypothetical protein DACRYDRAFT_24503 [Dacryopinax primogenitus]|uniref:Uncharacterized protein n=1 Tax=Dacryopinax primogenitus (strain DJM 731) TaxID=1858805 RepID=M5FY16_DACPD|nr:uncharacterized protein DACRYDRAFT_24503 [Dacryopinax primogenitus]EJT98451.1 hypothetical protein DACRYDRAFT_24503 [Dacryopinax primogenitus]